ncbi:MAG: hypothetical protein H7A37_02325 [Chlamydiales bacterium]|nr:hypothetical protein [Chlamydiales bacterium]
MPITFQSGVLVATDKIEKTSSSLLVKIFSRSLFSEEDVTIIPSNGGNPGIATFIITDKIVYLKNHSIPRLEEKYPQLVKIHDLAKSFVWQLDSGCPTYDSISDFARKAQNLEGVIIHGLKSSDEKGPNKVSKVI